MVRKGLIFGDSRVKLSWENPEDFVNENATVAK